MDNWSTVPKPTSREVKLMLYMLQTWFQSAEAEEQLIESLKSKPNNATGREMEVSWVWNASSNDIWGTGMFVCINVVVSCNFFTFSPFRSGRRNTSSLSMRWVQELEEFQEGKKLHCEGNSVMESKIDLNTGESC